MTSDREPLDALVPALAWTPDWEDVLVRAGHRVSWRRKVVLVAVACAAVLIPLGALAAADDWWFLRTGNPPTPVHAPVVVKEGSWSGHRWQLIAYPSATDGLCFSVTPKGSEARGEGAAMSCGPQVGVPRTPTTKGSRDMAITYLMSGAGEQLPAYIAGPVVETAATVEVRLANARVLRLRTFAAPPPLEHVRFYAAQLPPDTIPAPAPGSPPLLELTSVAGLDAGGRVVACLALDDAKDGISPLSACR